MDAKQIVFLILIFVIVGIVFILNIFAKAYFYGNLLNKMKNNSGNYNASKILMMFFVGIAIYFLILFLFMRKNTTRASLTRSKDDTN
jgi:uncharacterized membrane protein